jgi:hypothetical protein
MLVQKINENNNKQYLGKVNREDLSDNVKKGYLQKLISYSEINTNPVNIGIIPEGACVFKTSIEVTDGFSNNFIASIGSDESQGLLMITDDSQLSKVEKYIVHNDIKFNSNTMVKLFKAGSNSTTGYLLITVQYN